MEHYTISIFTAAGVAGRPDTEHKIRNVAPHNVNTALKSIATSGFAMSNTYQTQIILPHEIKRIEVSPPFELVSISFEVVS